MSRPRAPRGRTVRRTVPARPAARRRRDSAGDGFGEVDQALIERILGPFKAIRSYCRVTAEGLQHLPAGPGLLAANHTGWIGLDYANLAMTVHDATGRIVRGVVHPLWFKAPAVARIAGRLGLMPARRTLLVEILRRGQLTVIFPEAEHGAFKPSVDEPYRLQPFKRGFVRAAIQARAPILPVAIVGGEEANPVLRTVRWTDRWLNLPLPVPRNLLPYPVKWRLSFLAPVPTDEYRPRDATDDDLVDDLVRTVRDRIQRELGIQLRKRGHKYL